MRSRARSLLAALSVLALLIINSKLSTLYAQGTAFTYQGQLQNNGSLANGTFNLEFLLYTNSSGGTSVAGPVTTNGVIITNGLFTVTIDFGAAVWNGSTNWLQIEVETNGGGTFTPLNPRQEVTPTPYSIYAEGANAAGLSGTIPSGDFSGVYSGPITLSNPANSFSGNGGGLTNVNASTLGGFASSNFWKTTGNANINANLNYVGTTDLNPLVMRVNGLRALELLPTVNATDYSNLVNVVGGSPFNYIASGVYGATIAGGGASTYFFVTSPSNGVTADLGTIGGGAGNTVSATGGTVAGGENNTSGGIGADMVVGGGQGNSATASYATVAGGSGNSAGAFYATVGGGTGNSAGLYSAVAGGTGNNASGEFSGVAGGSGNVAGGEFAMIPGGNANTAAGQGSFAAGQNAQALYDGSFVWADNTGGVFTDHNTNQFLIRAQGGVGIGTVSGPQQYLSVHGGLNIDQINLNAGFLNSGSNNGFGLSFGSSSGEGIASKRTSGGNQYGLDFYTGYSNRMSITQSGFVGIGTQTPVNAGDTQFQLYSPTTTGFDGMWIETGVGGLPFYGYSEGGGFTAYTYVDGQNGNTWDLYDSGVRLSVMSSGNVGIGTTTPSQKLEVNGNYAQIDGANANNGNGPIDAYIGGNGSGNDVQVGSFNSLISNVAFYNWGNNTYMHIFCSAITIEGGSDLAEPFKFSTGDDKVPQGAVVVIDDQNPGRLKLSQQAYDTKVAGVVSGANGINPGIQMQQKDLLEGGKNVALTGRVYVQADTSNGAIKPGDLLTTSSTAGYAMKVTNHAKAEGAILGKAMTGLSKGKGMVLVLVTLQ